MPNWRSAAQFHADRVFAAIVVASILTGMRQSIVSIVEDYGTNNIYAFHLTTGFGGDGPYAARPAYDNVGQTLSGWLSLFHDGADPRIAGPAVADAVATAAAAVDAAAAVAATAAAAVVTRAAKAGK